MHEGEVSCFTKWVVYTLTMIVFPLFLTAALTFFYTCSIFLPTRIHFLLVLFHTTASASIQRPPFILLQAPCISKTVAPPSRTLTHKHTHCVHVKVPFRMHVECRSPVCQGCVLPSLSEESFPKLNNNNNRALSRYLITWTNNKYVHLIHCDVALSCIGLYWHVALNHVPVHFKMCRNWMSLK